MRNLKAVEIPNLDESSVELGELGEALSAKFIEYPNPASSIPLYPNIWDHPMLELFVADIPKEPVVIKVPSKLYLVPSSEYLSADLANSSDSDFGPQPSRLEELPDLEDWVQKFVLTVVEIWGGRRSHMQLARWTHRQVYQQLVKKSAAITQAPKIRKIYISQPIEGVAETTVTLKIGERVRSLILRFEGVDKRWLCTEMVVL